MSTIRVDNFGPSAGGTTFPTFGVAKVSVAYDQTAPQVRSSQNVASVTDNSAGNFTINYTNNMDVPKNVETALSRNEDGTGLAYVTPNSTCDDPTTALSGYFIGQGDADYVSVSIEGDLA